MKIFRHASRNIINLKPLFSIRPPFCGWGRGFETDLDAFKARIDSLLSQSPPLSVSDLAVNGDDVMTLLGIRPGPEVGEILDRLVTLVIEKPEFNQKYKLLEFLKGMAKSR